MSSSLSGSLDEWSSSSASGAGSDAEGLRSSSGAEGLHSNIVDAGSLSLMGDRIRYRRRHKASRPPGPSLNPGPAAPRRRAPVPFPSFLSVPSPTPPLVP